MKSIISLFIIFLTTALCMHPAHDYEVQPYSKASIEGGELVAK